MFLRNTILTLLYLSFNPAQLLAEPLELDLDISKLKLGRLINNRRDNLLRGANKSVYAVEGHSNLVALETETGPLELNRELEIYRSLYKNDHRALEVFPAVVAIEGKDILLAKRYLYGSKSNLEFYLTLNSKSINHLSNISRSLKRKDHYITDLQFLIEESGRIVIADPLDFYHGYQATWGTSNDAFLALENNIQVLMDTLRDTRINERRLRFARDDVSPQNIRRNLIRLIPERENRWHEIISHEFEIKEFDFTKKRSKRPVNRKPSTQKSVASSLNPRKPQGKRK